VFWALAGNHLVVEQHETKKSVKALETGGTVASGGRTGEINGRQGKPGEVAVEADAADAAAAAAAAAEAARAAEGCEEKKSGGDGKGSSEYFTQIVFIGIDLQVSQSWHA
jgi:5-enolpyruvylshikimate-3-phosphate synthase